MTATNQPEARERRLERALRITMDALAEYLENDIVHWEQSHSQTIDDWWLTKKTQDALDAARGLLAACDEGSER